MSNGWTTHISNAESCTDQDYVAGMHDNVAAKISSRNFGKSGATARRRWSASTASTSRSGSGWSSRTTTRVRTRRPTSRAADGKSALAFIHYLLSAKGQAVLATFGYDPIS